MQGQSLASSTTSCGARKIVKKVLVGDVEIRLKNVLYATAAQYGVLIEAMEVLPDHVHLFVSQTRRDA